MARRDPKKGTVVKKLVNGTFFDVRQVPEIETNNKTGISIIKKSSYGLYVGKHKVKIGFKTADEAGQFATDNLKKYNKKTKKFA